MNIGISAPRNINVKHIKYTVCCLYSHILYTALNLLFLLLLESTQKLHKTEKDSDTPHTRQKKMNIKSELVLFSEYNTQLCRRFEFCICFMNGLCVDSRYCMYLYAENYN